MPSLSASSSQASPDPSLSASSWPELGTNTQLSCKIKTHLFYASWIKWGREEAIGVKYLVTVVVSAEQLIVWISVNISIFSTHITIASPTNATLRDRTTDRKQFIKVPLSDKGNLLSMPVGTMYHTANASISLHNALAIDVTRVRLTIGAKSGSMTAC